MAILLLTSLAGCASLPDARPASSQEPQVWRGRFALNVEPNAQAPQGQRSSGSFELTHADTFTELALRSPLGNTLAAARSDARGATLTTADGRIERADSTDALTERLFGWPIPVQRLPVWLTGRIAQVTETTAGTAGSGTDGKAAAPLPAAGIESGWQVRFDAWDGRQPRRLTIVYPQRLTLRLIVDDR